MTLLDDYEASYKLRGIKLVSEMLARAPNDLLRRTGVDQLLFTVRRIQQHFSPSHSNQLLKVSDNIPYKPP